MNFFSRCVIRLTDMLIGSHMYSINKCDDNISGRISIKQMLIESLVSELSEEECEILIKILQYTLKGKYERCEM